MEVSEIVVRLYTVERVEISAVASYRFSYFGRAPLNLPTVRGYCRRARPWDAPNPNPIVDLGNLGGAQFSEAGKPITHSLLACATVQTIAHLCAPRR